MGASSARAMTIINSAIDTSITIGLSNTQDCNQRTDVSFVNIQGCVDCDICSQNISDIKFKASAHMNQKCIADFKVDADVTNKISNEFEQAAEAVNEGLNIGANSSDARTITSLSESLATAISVNLGQSVSQIGTQLIINSNYALRCQEAHQSIHDISFDSFMEQTQEGVMSTDTVVRIKNDLDNAIKQVATAKNVGLNMNFLAALIIGVILIIVVFMLSGKTLVKSLFGTIPGMIVVLVIIYLVVAAYMGFFPFNYGRDKAVKPSCSDDDPCTDGLACDKGVCKVACGSDDDCGEDGSCVDGMCDV